MSESDRGHPIQAALIVLLFVGGGWYFIRHYKIDGLDDLVILPKSVSSGSEDFADGQMLTGEPSLASDWLGQNDLASDADRQFIVENGSRVPVGLDSFSNRPSDSSKAGRNCTITLISSSGDWCSSTQRRAVISMTSAIVARRSAPN